VVPCSALLDIIPCPKHAASNTLPQTRCPTLRTNLVASARQARPQYPATCTGLTACAQVPTSLQVQGGPTFSPSGISLALATVLERSRRLCLACYTKEMPPSAQACDDMVQRWVYICVYVCCVCHSKRVLCLACYTKEMPPSAQACDNMVQRCVCVGVGVGRIACKPPVKCLVAVYYVARVSRVPFYIECTPFHPHPYLYPHS